MGGAGLVDGLLWSYERVWFIGGDTASIGGTATYADRPTITYTPISGRKFASSLLTPVAPENIFALVQAGWPADVILRLTVRSINGIDNEWASPANRKVADPRFTELLRVWGRLRKSRTVGLRRDQGKTGARIFVYHSAQGLTDEGKRDLAFLQDILGLDPDVTEYQLSYGRVPDGPNEIRVMTSSILQIMNELAWRIDVPPEHVDAGLQRSRYSYDPAISRLSWSTATTQRAATTSPGKDC